MSNLVVGPGSHVFMHFNVGLTDGSVADSTRAHGQPARLTLGDGSLSPGMEKELLGLAKGDTKKFTLEADQAFGQSNPDNLQHMTRTQFAADADMTVGTIMAFDAPDGNQYPGVIREVAGDSVTVDFNHPLAGQTVVFDVEILDVVAKEA
ncbi:FKBP-type peptidyl-prolyl cis-trans isomerase [Ferrimonas lipolytica]|uniref:Peptidyl-prolyl cis-trans isomerase n=1 Tax=Ferrimonas lipolytica TaxID=2724191 RepID=A0A6H1UA84_9GAMM|nr:FKBP-type peptidyl-prolyl cis-trans isomerase [Ferrimonas lipolytica]QIZ75500.1 FKBP-type peptidyl-prolyl cis-trans isomerase [Ferrimonas lipolytica]